MLKSHKVLIGIGVIAVIFYFVGFFMLHNEIWNPLTQAYSSLPDPKKTLFWGEFLFKTTSLILTVLILKYLLAMEPFKDSIKEIFKEIFTEYHFLKDYDKNTLLKVAKNVNKANKDIEFIDKTQDQESIKKLMDFFRSTDKNKNKNYLVMESKYTTTLYASGIEIMHRKIKCKIIQEGHFKFEYWFNAPNNDQLSLDTYKNTSNNNRFAETSYKSMLTSSAAGDGFEVKDNFSMKKVEGEKYILIEFSKVHTTVDEIIDIEFSISHPFKLASKEDIENYYSSTYIYPHAVRKIVFQREKYIENSEEEIPEFSPILYSENDEIIPGKYSENIYYKSYSWDVYFSQEESSKVSIKID